MERRSARLIASGLALAGVLVLLDQLATLVPLLGRAEPTAPGWRVQLFGAALSRLTPILLADALLLGAAAVLGSRALLRALGWGHALLGMALLAVTFAYGLDAIEVRRGVPLESRTGFTLGVVRLAGMGGLTALFAGWVGFALNREKNLPEKRAVKEGGRILVSTSMGRGVDE